jgi:hypothetical protein
LPVDAHLRPCHAFRPPFPAIFNRQSSILVCAVPVLPRLTRIRVVRSPARLLRNTATNVVEHVPIPKTNSNADSQ